MSFSGQVQICTESVDIVSQHDYWQEAINQYVIHIDCPDVSQEALNAELRHFHGEEININYISANKHAIQRSRTDISEDERDSIFICLMTKGNGYSYQGTCCASHMPGDIVIYDTTKPYGHGFPQDMGMFVLDVPRNIAIEHFGVLDDLIKIDRNFQCEKSSTQNILSLLESNDKKQPSTELNIEEILFHTQILLGGRSEKAYGKNRNSLYIKCKDFIDQYLNYPDLNIEMISNHFHVSNRQIARAFASNNVTVSRYIWQSRLRKSREDILVLDNLSITDIAFKWGFNHSSHFSRAYKQCFNESPQYTRKQK